LSPSDVFDFDLMALCSGGQVELDELDVAARRQVFDLRWAPLSRARCRPSPTHPPPKRHAT
jgi:hypothetical protein